MPSSGVAASTSVRTRADPTMTPSANSPTSAAWSPLETPSPTHTGRSVTSRVRATSDSAAEPTVARVPVTPMSEAA